MDLPKVNFANTLDSSDGLASRKYKSEHKALFAYLIDSLTEESPHLKSCQIKAMAVEKFLGAAGIDVICIDTFYRSDYGTGIFNKQTRKKIGFIKTNAPVVNALHDLYFDGVFNNLNVEDCV